MAGKVTDEHDAMRALMRRPGLALSAPSPQHCALALTHQFYDKFGYSWTGRRYAKDLRPGPSSIAE